MTLRDILADIHTPEEALSGFEQAYGVRSETLYTAYMSGTDFYAIMQADREVYANHD